MHYTNYAALLRSTAAAVGSSICVGRRKDGQAVFFSRPLVLWMGGPGCELCSAAQSTHQLPRCSWGERSFRATGTRQLVRVEATRLGGFGAEEAACAAP